MVLLAPSWWILGTLLSHGGKEAWHEHLASRHMGRVIATPAQINSKNILVLLTIWHEIISQLILKKEDHGQLRFDKGSPMRNAGSRFKKDPTFKFAKQVALNVSGPTSTQKR